MLSYYCTRNAIWNWWLSVTAAFPGAGAGRKNTECIRVGLIRQAALALAVKPDVVSVCHPTASFHMNIFLDGAGSGPPRDVRKPPAMTVEQAREM